MQADRGSDSATGVAPVLDESTSGPQMHLSLRSSLTFSFRCPETQEAVAWIRSTSEEMDEEMDKLMAGGRDIELMFHRVEIDIALAHLLRKDVVASLELCFLEMTKHQLLILLDALRHNAGFRELVFSDVQFDADGISALSTLLRHNMSIKKFQLSNAALGDTGAVLIGEALTQNETLEELHLWSNQFGLEGALVLGKLLQVHSCLTRLDLSMNALGNEGAIALTDGLKNNNTLRKLLLFECGISVDGAEAIADLLQYNLGLTHLNLSHNELGEDGILALANSLKHNTSLKKLDVDNICLLNGEDPFIDALEHNVSLLKLSRFPTRERDTIDALLLRNKEEIPAAVRRAALFIIGVCQSTNFDGMGDFAIFPKDVVSLIAQAVWATRKDPIWIEALSRI